MSQRFVEFSWKGRRYRVWDEGADMVSLERIQKGERRPVRMPGTDLLEAGKAALADRPCVVIESHAHGRWRPVEPPGDAPLATDRPPARVCEKLVREGFLSRLEVKEPVAEPYAFNLDLAVKRYRVTVEEIPEDDAVIAGRLLALQQSKQGQGIYAREAIVNWARRERYRLSPDHLPPDVRAAKSARLEALVSLAESLPKRGGLTKKDRPAAWDEFEMLRKHLTPNARGVRHTDIADGGELEWMVRHAQTMLASYAERCSEEGKHALRQKIRDGITACLGEGQ